MSKEPLELFDIPCDQIFSQVMNHIRTYEGQIFGDLHGMTFWFDVANVSKNENLFKGFLQSYQSDLQQLFLYNNEESGSIDYIITSLDNKSNSPEPSDSGTQMNELSNEGQKNLDQILRNLTLGHSNTFRDIIDKSDRSEVVSIMNERDRLITGHFVEFLKTVLDNFDTDKNSFTDLYMLYTKSGLGGGNGWLNDITNVHEEDGNKN